MALQCRKAKLAKVLPIWGAAVAVHATYYVITTLRLPDIPDAYARTIGFQVMMFGLLRFPLWLAVLGAVMIWLARGRSSNPAMEPAGTSGGASGVRQSAGGSSPGR